MKEMQFNKIELLKTVLNEQSNYIFSEKDYFSKEFFEICWQYGTIKVFKWVAPPSKWGAKLYHHWIKCKKCNIEETIYSDIDTFRTLVYSLKYPNGEKRKKYICNNCKEIMEKRDKELEIEYKKSNAAKKEKLINDFKQLLNPNNSWAIPLKKQFFQEHYKTLVFYIDQNEIASYIQKIPYIDFLKTPYWKLVSWYVKARANFECKLCKNNQNLNVHHPTYDCHGYEMQKYEELICLCKSCHSQYHDKNNNV